MRRREFISALGCWLVAKPVCVNAEELSRIGFLRVGAPPPSWIGRFREGLREQGLIEGQNVLIDFALAPTAAKIPEAAAELVARRVDIIVAAGTPSVFPARDAAGKIPVVFVATFDPVSTGLVASLSRPGGNVTGMTSISGDLVTKRLAVAKELLPDLTKVALLVRGSSPTAPQYVEQSRAVAQSFGIELQVLTARDPNDLEEIIAAAHGANVLMLGDDAEFTAHRLRIAELALKNRLPTVHGLREMVDAGGLMSYGASFGDLYRRAASQVRKILRGANAGDLPIEQPTTFELVLNMRTAKALALAVPPAFLARADEVIE
jgi:putative tryptophan/tyrosine transport system substrate-binding protein